MSGLTIEGNGGVVVDVTSASSTTDLVRALHVTLSQDDGKAGKTAIVGESDNGTITGTKRRIAFEPSDDFRMRVGIDTPIFEEVFAGSAINSAQWASPITTHAVAVGSAFLTLNSGSSVAANGVSRVSSYRLIPLATASGTTWFECHAQFPFAPQANNTLEWGLFIATGTSAPTDGVFFRVNSAGVFRAVACINSVEVESSDIDFAALVGTATTREFLIGVHNNVATFWIDAQLVAEIPISSAMSGLTASASVPITFRNYVGGSPMASAQQIKVSAVFATIGDVATNKPYAHAQAGMGRMAYQGQTGGTMGSTAQFANSANPTAAVPTNTTAALATGLGGQFWETDTLAVNTDGIVQSFQNPAGTAALPGKTLYITGVKIESFVQTALTGGGYNAVWSLAFGHNTVSLASAEASGSSTKAPRRIALGQQSVASGLAVLSALNTVQMQFQSPVVVNPGEFVQAVKKKVGTAPSAGVIAHIVTYDGYYE